MKFKVALLGVLFFSLGLVAQEWQSDFDKALGHAKSVNKPMLLVFSGSDWCAPCIKLDHEIWQSKTFQDFAATNLVLYRADFPRKKKNKLAAEVENSNKKLADRYNAQGFFPLVVVLDGGGNVLGKLGYEKVEPQRYIDQIMAYVP